MCTFGDFFAVTFAGDVAATVAAVFHVLFATAGVDGIGSATDQGQRERVEGGHGVVDCI